MPNHPPEISVSLNKFEIYTEFIYTNSSFLCLSSPSVSGSNIQGDSGGVTATDGAHF
jgi:hypothetical protein